eukprot:TRINITY_DN51173_c0_g1_i1.p1 TRINITY_DN51173_c0_g1~~TRINITY_DN51173_c0_g1_i1.p1  ORF type:complete len:376 (-),score=87.58 TRINITY_DN51173_c0_g1_i1:237-1364(-)
MWWSQVNPESKPPRRGPDPKRVTNWNLGGLKSPPEQRQEELQQQQPENTWRPAAPFFPHLLAVEPPQRRARPMSAPAGAGRSDGSQAGALGSKAPGASSDRRARTPSASSTRRGRDGPRPLKARPRSAPTLLRGDGEGFRVSFPHPAKDAFLQRVEDFQVKRCLQGFRVEGIQQKEKVSGVDVLADTTLFDLKVLHNACQREKTEAVKKAEKEKEETQKQMAQMEAKRKTKKPIMDPVEAQANWKNLGAYDKMRTLRRQMEDNINHHTHRLDAFEELGFDRPSAEESKHSPEMQNVLRNLSADLDLKGLFVARGGLQRRGTGLSFGLPAVECLDETQGGQAADTTDASASRRGTLVQRPSLSGPLAARSLAAAGA